ncbi:hypothetical protein TIFTF001_036057 [Ficus carica]|uniref:Uncharacterized protein n=1 Tax=Ficus carica TaxID=3494 RepID=A0AA88JAA6_FICCA|nr:hypothetical protein TIFTF001_036057 [Ficus carica]
MFTIDNSYGKNKIKFQVRFGPWFELDWAGCPNHSMAARHVVLAELKLMTYVYAVVRLAWLEIKEDKLRLNSMTLARTNHIAPCVTIATHGLVLLTWQAHALPKPQHDRPLEETTPLGLALMNQHSRLPSLALWQAKACTLHPRAGHSRECHNKLVALMSKHSS